MLPGVQSFHPTITAPLSFSLVSNNSIPRICQGCSKCAHCVPCSCSRIAERRSDVWHLSWLLCLKVTHLWKLSPWRGAAVPQRNAGWLWTVWPGKSPVVAQPCVAGNFLPSLIPLSLLRPPSSQLPPDSESLLPSLELLCRGLSFLYFTLMFLSFCVFVTSCFS